MSAEDQMMLEKLQAKKKAGTISTEEQKKLDEMLKAMPAGKPAPSG